MAKCVPFWSEVQFLEALDLATWETSICAPSFQLYPTLERGGVCNDSNLNPALSLPTQRLEDSRTICNFHKRTVDLCELLVGQSTSTLYGESTTKVKYSCS